MKFNFVLFVLLAMMSFGAFANKNQNKPMPTIEGLELPDAYKDWKVISASHRTDNNTMRIILGNDIAIKASRENQTNP